MTDARCLMRCLEQTMNLSNYDRGSQNHSKSKAEPLGASTPGAREESSRDRCTRTRKATKWSAQSLDGADPACLPDS